MSDHVSILTGIDSRARCAWVGSDPEYQRYHDEEWGVALHGDRALFEKLSLEAFQAGLSWITILRRRESFRAAFAGFELESVAALGESDVERLMGDASIIRNRAKIRATIENARLALAMTRIEPGAFDTLMWSHAPLPSSAAPNLSRADHRPRTLDEIPTATAESAALSGRLRALGFRFVGPVTMYALMQSTGMVDDHVVGCWRAS